ncbi:MULTISPECIES: PsiF family protein [Acidithiobacillus]|uniref:PsiF family protein n=1 Tax=Acidithiobacillus TaxID=119977 RepID=UPI000983734B|nr:MULTISPECIES: PsiF family protein [Acidithiobacillus]MBE7567441.1 phosphate starvation-inducible protein PsiF [Acidithiobacillus sp. HP-11]MBU2741973.1 phosphate starvation-inducible protein PsiF [Acidithiobacillus albertensis]MBU2752538.1 phosphate starvation-inducible protein PsiF [Acidithiobacillus thiooxidans]MBU2793008.1 phosphate starvation-inducible protein PsiF [Acidithiobacillus thiooxidans]MBU2834910.1 phosphate starvation-inducible protein PsiF [Acidithiobacillus thiooxidans]
MLYNLPKKRNERCLKNCNVIAVLVSCCPALTFAETATHAVKPLTPHQERMKTCNADAKGKKGAERKAFMKSCLGNK